MANSNKAAIAAKVEKYAASKEGKKNIEAQVEKLPQNKKKRMMYTNEAELYAQVERMGRELVDSIIAEAIAEGVPESVLEHLRTARIEAKPYARTDIMVRIYFGGDMSRESMYDKEKGIKNIVALFNNGYEASAQVRGTWEPYSERKRAEGYSEWWISSHPAISRQSRPALRFIQRGSEKFLRRYPFPRSRFYVDYNSIYEE